MSRWFTGPPGGTVRLRALLEEGVSTPDISAWEPFTQPRIDSGPGDGPTATFLGVSTVLLRDRDTAILTDGFFSRPNVVRTAIGRVRPNPRRIAAGLRLAEVDRLDAVFVVHSHIDHALDSAAVAHRTGAWLLGSDSTRQISRGQRFPQERFLRVVAGEPVRFGAFTLTAVEARHSPGDVGPGIVDAPLEMPARTGEFRTGECYSLFVTHRDRTVLVHASADAVPGALDGHRAETVYLGIGTLGTQSDRFREDYWREVVEAVGARRVVPIHWDDFTRGLHRPMRPLPRPFDDVPRSLAWLQRRAERAGVAFAMPRFAEPVSPWSA